MVEYVHRLLLARVKVASYILFPDVLDLSSYIGGPAVYHLSSMVAHHGPSAYSGHYTAYIKDHKVLGIYGSLLVLYFISLDLYR